MPIGNDVVDLSEARNHHCRFITFACTQEEQDEIGNHRDGLWIYWAIKESAYKAFKKIDSTIQFQPKQFVVHKSLQVCCFKEREIPIYLEQTPQYVHAIAATSPHFRSEVTKRRRVLSESEDVRTMLLDRLQQMGYSNCTITSGKPPQLWIEQLQIEVSLSHDGDCVAWAFLN